MRRLTAVCAITALFGLACAPIQEKRFHFDRVVSQTVEVSEPIPELRSTWFVENGELRGDIRQVPLCTESVAITIDRHEVTERHYSPGAGLLFFTELLLAGTMIPSSFLFFGEQTNEDGEKEDNTGLGVTLLTLGLANAALIVIDAIRVADSEKTTQGLALDPAKSQIVCGDAAPYNGNVTVRVGGAEKRVSVQNGTVRFALSGGGDIVVTAGDTTLFAAPADTLATMLALAPRAPVMAPTSAPAPEVEP